MRRLVLLLVLAATACRHPTPRPAVECGGRHTFSNDERLAAVLSIHRHALFPKVAYGDAERKRMRLATAVDVLRCDLGPGGLSRRQRAIATLFAYGFAEHRFDDQIRDLGGDPDTIKRAVEEAHPATHELIFHDAPWLNQVVANLPPETCGVPPPTDPCEKTIKKERPDDVRDKGPVLLMTATVSVASPVSTVATSIDPRRWDNCGFFWDPPEDATHFAAVDVSGNPVVDPSHTPPPRVGCWAQKDSTTGSAIGTPFNPRPLFEDFSLDDPSGVSARFDNVLTVSVRDDPDPILGTIHRVTYDLAPNGYMCGSIDGVHTTVIRDEGHLWAWTDSGRTWVEFHKEIEYGNPNTTQLAAVVTAHASLADELGAIVCCLK